MITDRKRCMTLVETIVSVCFLVLAASMAMAGFSGLSENAMSVKCLNNLKRSMNATQAYIADNKHFLPGPLFQAVIPDVSNISNEIDRYKSITWHLRPYFDAPGDASTNPATPDPIVDKLHRCPLMHGNNTYTTGEDQTFTRPDFTYVLNSSGPLGYGDEQWHHTNPPHYFGIWLYADQWPESNSQYENRAWKPKPILMINNPSQEWLMGDAWYRMGSTGSGRPGQPAPRDYLGTAASIRSTSVRFSYPPHDAGPQPATTSSLPSSLPLTGMTNHSYFDGHAASFIGNWRTLGEGGTINPYWHDWDGIYYAWYPGAFDPDNPLK